MALKLKSQNYVPLHNHSEYSYLDSVIKVKGLGSVLRKKGFSAYAMTEHGNVNGVYEFVKDLNGAGVKPLIGCEFYMVPDRHRKGLSEEEKAFLKTDAKDKGIPARQAIKTFEGINKIRRRNHVVVLAKNNKGWRKIIRAVELSHKEGFYYFPRIDYDILKKLAPDVIVLTACIAGVPSQLILENNYDGAIEWCGEMAECFGSDFFIEIQPNDIKEQVELNIGLADIACDLGVGIVATNDIHYLTQDDYVTHDVLLALRESQGGRSVLVTDENRFRYSTNQLYLKTCNEMELSFEKFHPDLERNVWKNALDKTQEIAERIDSNVLESRRGILPILKIEEEYEGNHDNKLWDLVREGWKWRQIDRKCKGKSGVIDWLDEEKPKETTLKKVYIERVKFEMGEITRLGFARYFLVVWDLIKWARKNNIRVGPGRGSVGGSLVAYLLGITSVDSVKYKCPWSRFISPDRIDYPDIDCFTPDTSVLTIDGWKEIQDIIPGVDVVATRHGWRKVTAKHFRHYNGLVFKFVTSSGKIFRCTPQHRIIRYKQESLRADEWNKNTAIMLSVRSKIQSNTWESEILYPGVQKKKIESSHCRKAVIRTQKVVTKRERVQDLWGNFYSWSWSSKILRRLPTLVEEETCKRTCNRTQMQKMWGSFLSNPWSSEILHSGMCDYLQQEKTNEDKGPKKSNGSGGVLSGRNFLRYLREVIYKTVPDPQILWQGMRIPWPEETKVYGSESLRNLRETIQGYAQAEILLEAMWKETYWNNIEKFIWPYWNKGGYWSFCTFFTRGGFREVLEQFKYLLRIRTLSDYFRGWEFLLSRFFYSGMERVRGIEGLGGAGFREANSNSKRDGQTWLQLDCFVPGDSNGNDRGCDSEWSGNCGTGAGNEKVETFDVNRQDLRKVRKKFQGHEESSLLLQGLCKQFTKGKKIQWGVSRRKNGKAMCHMWETNVSSSERKQKKVLQSGMSEQIICRKETITKEAQDYNGLVYNLTVEGEAEYNSAGIAVHNCDFSGKNRDRIKKYLIFKYGKSKVASIITFGRMKGKLVLKDVGRVHGVPWKKTEQITKMVPLKADGDEGAFECLKDTFKTFPETAWYKERWPDVVMHAQKLEGNVRQSGVHAAGLVISDEPLRNLVPVQYQKAGKGDYLVGWDKKQVEAVGLLKLDILGIDSLQYIQRCLDLIEERTGERIEPEEWEDLNDEFVLRNFAEGNTELVWQMNSLGAIRLLKKLRPDRFDHLVAATALIRPGPQNAGITDEYIKRRNGESTKSLHAKLDEILDETYGLMVFQEDVIRIVHDIGGFTWGEADRIRKDIGKKKGVEYLKKTYLDRFVSGAAEHDMSEAVAKKLWYQIAEFGQYGFNLSHSVGYTMLSYWTMYLKVYHPLEYMCAALETEDKADKQKLYIREAKRLGIKVTVPDVNISGNGYVIDPNSKNTIRAGLVDVKGLGDKTVDKIVAAAPYNSFRDFVERSGANKTAIVALLRIGALDSLVDEPKHVEENIVEILKVRTRKKPHLKEKYWTKIQGEGLLEVDEGGEYTTKERDEYKLALLSLPPEVHPTNEALEWVTENCPHLTFQPIDRFEELFPVDFSNTYYFFLGAITKVKYFQDAISTDDADDSENSFGNRVARVYLEDDTGALTCRLGPGQLRNLEASDLSAGQLLIVVAHNVGFYNLSAAGAVSLGGLVRAREEGAARALSGLPGAVLRDPFAGYRQFLQGREKLKTFKTGRSKFRVCVFVISAETKVTKKRQKMMTVCCQDLHGDIRDVLVWPSDYSRYAKKIKEHELTLLHLKGRKEGGKERFYFLNTSTGKNPIMSFDKYYKANTDN